MQIGICDDSPELCTMLTKTLRSCTYIPEPVLIEEFHSAKELLASPKAPELELIFLDIEMPGMSGMELLRQHRQVFHNAKMVLLTFYTEYALEGYEVEVYRFLPKPVQEEKLFELFQSIEADQILNQTIRIRCEGIDVCMRIGDIQYAEVYSNYLYIVTPQKTWKAYMRLKELISALPEAYFYQPHKSYIVNMNYIREFDKKHRTLRMANDRTLDIAIRNKKAFEKAYTEFTLRS